MDIVEKMARSDAAFDGRTFDALGRADKSRYLSRCIAALKAVRESPTPRMIEMSRTCLKRISDDERWAITMSHRQSHEIKMRARWKAMIDAAIVEAEYAGNNQSNAAIAEAGDLGEWE